VANFLAVANGTVGTSFPWTITFRLTGSVSEASALTGFESSMESFFTDATNGILKLCSSQVSVTGYSVSTATAAWRQTTKSSATVSHAGTGTGESLPYTDSCVITWRSPNANKSGHGRTYLPPFVIGSVVGGAFTSATTTQVKTQATALRTALSTAGLTMVVFNRSVLVDGTAAFTLKTITHEDVPNLVAHQRRRTDKRAATRS
jgi:hypothetical protein